jgi:hypothetical protein
MADHAEDMKALTADIKRHNERVVNQARLSQSDDADLKSVIATLRAEMARNHATTINDLGSLRLAVDALPKALADMLADRDKGS